MADETASAAVGAVAGLYLGNILFAIERCAMVLDEEQKDEEAAFYRGIARKLAEARAADRGAQPKG
jgi:hypothetical protein